MFGFIFTLLLLGAGFVGFLTTLMFRSWYTSENRRGEVFDYSGRWRAGFLTLSTLMLVTAVLQSITIVEPGYRGVAVTFGHIQDEPIPEGPNLIAPWTDVHHMDVRVKKHYEKYEAQTADTQRVGINMIINWRPDANHMPTLFQQYGVGYSDIIIPQAVQEALKAEIARHKITDLTEQRPLISDRVKDAINETLNQYNVSVVECGIGDIQFSDKYDHAIEEKQQREQEALQKQYELERTQVEARMAEAEAQGRANARLAEATATAEAVRLQAQAKSDALSIEAEAQAEYNRRVAESLTDPLLRLRYLETWNGQLPTYMMGDTATTMMIPMGSR